MRRAKRIGLLGGTFNPVHLGHLILAQDAMERFKFDEVLFIPCATPPHKSPSRLADGRHRIAMLKAAIRPFPRFGVSDVEVRRGGVSYSVDTLRDIRRRRPNARFYFIIGADMLRELHTWRSIGELFKLCDFVTMKRPGDIINVSRLAAHWRGRVLTHVFEGHQTNVASTEIRGRAARGRCIAHLVPDAVVRYIAAHGLYRKKESRRSTRST